MAIVYNIAKGILNSIPVIATKVATFVLLLFTLGLVIGYTLGITGRPPTYVIIPVIALIVMWYKLDEGFLIFILLSILAFLFPDILAL
jgi:hypothetical protein